MDPIGIVRLGDENFEFPIMEGTEAERAIDLRTLRSKTGYIAFDEGYGNTGSCESGITFINGEKGILRHRGYPIEQLAEQSSFLETAYLIIYGELPSEVALKAFERNILSNATLDGKMYRSLKASIKTLTLWPCYHRLLIHCVPTIQSTPRIIVKLT